MESDVSAKKSKDALTLKLDYRMIIGLLVVIIIAMLLLWRPWEPRIDAKSRTIDVTGEAKVTAVPDEFVFAPSYDFQNADKAAALGDLTKKSEEIVKKLKDLGVADNKIKTNSDGYDYPIYNKEDSSTPTYTLRLTVTVNDKDLAQKVQDYLVDTSPTGAISPQLAFSDAKRKELEGKARDDATKEARSKAEQSAKNLGFNLGEIKSVNDGGNFGGVYPMLREGVSSDSIQPSKLSLQPGENDLSYQVSVVYYVK
ncbi:MAG TPA: SIMPL domain-containing protein [Candidatus Saccharimonadales bacterium]|nr:SIMPL domain-containing protein [Candidatus Saccharimonadales bacterium]